MKLRPIGHRELLAIDPGAIHRGADGFFLMLAGDPIPASHRHAKYDDVTLVYVRGSLEHHSGSGGDNYEDILERVHRAMDGREGDEAHDPPTAVIMCIDSKGGVVAGLNETVAAIQKQRKLEGVRLIAYVNEMATSAAYALACACDEILCPPSAIVGSIGTISTMVSCAERDKADGLDVRLITSGARKADGHPHVPITDAAEAAERYRVERLAEDFFNLAGKARGVSADKLRALQAAIYLGPDARKKGLVDSVKSLDDVAMAVSKRATRTPAAKGNETDRRM